MNYNNSSLGLISYNNTCQVKEEIFLNGLNNSYQESSNSLLEETEKKMAKKKFKQELGNNIDGYKGKSKILIFSYKNMKSKRDRIFQKAKQYYQQGNIRKVLYTLSAIRRLNEDSINIIKNICLKITKKIPQKEKGLNSLSKGVSYIRKGKYKRAVYYLAQTLYYMPHHYSIRYLLLLNLLRANIQL